MRKKDKLYQLGSKLGLKKEDVDEVIINTSGNEQPSFPTDIYGTGRYGTISIKDFED